MALRSSDSTDEALRLRLGDPEDDVPGGSSSMMPFSLMAVVNVRFVDANGRLFRDVRKAEMVCGAEQLEVGKQKERPFQK